MRSLPISWSICAYDSNYFQTHAANTASSALTGGLVGDALLVATNALTEEAHLASAKLLCAYVHVIPCGFRGRPIIRPSDIRHGLLLTGELRSPSLRIHTSYGTLGYLWPIPAALHRLTGPLTPCWADMRRLSRPDLAADTLALRAM